MPFDSFTVQASGIQWCAIGCRDDADFARRNNGRLRHRDAEEIWVNRPQARRERAKLYAFDAATLDESNRVLKIVVRVLRSVEREDSARRHRLAVNGFDDAKLIGTDLYERNFPHDFLKG